MKAWRAASAALGVLTIASRSSADLSPAEAARRNVVIATVGPTSIHVGELEDRLAAMPDFQRAMYGSTEADVRRGVLERVLVRDAVVAASAEAKTDDPLVRYELNRARSTATLRALAATLPDSKHIPEADVVAYYEAHRASYQAPLRIHVWRLLVATAAEADAVLAAMKPTGTPDAWSKLCREKSLDEATKLRKGTLGFLSPDGSSSEAGVKAPAEMYQAALTVSDGELVPKPIPEGDHFAVVWRRGSTPAKSQPLETASIEIRRILYDTRFREAKEQLTARLRAARVKDVDDALLGSFQLDPATGAVRR